MQRGRNDLLEQAYRDLGRAKPNGWRMWWFAWCVIALFIVGVLK